MTLFLLSVLAQSMTTMSVERADIKKGRYEYYNCMGYGGNVLLTPPRFRARNHRTNMLQKPSPFYGTGCIIGVRYCYDVMLYNDESVIMIEGLA